jgi:hypothetical protein
MLKISQLLLGVISLFIVGILLFYTFFVQRNVSTKFLSSLDFSLGRFSVSDNNGKYIVKSGEKAPKDTSLTFERISPLDEIFFSKQASYSVKKIWNTKEIVLEKWDFAIYLYDIDKIPQIKWPWFIITPKWVGKIFVHIWLGGEWNRNYSIVSQDAILRLELTDLTRKEIYTEIALFPHTFLNFDPLKNSFLKNADRIRVYSVFNLGYLDIPLSKDISITAEKFSSLGFDNQFIKDEIWYAKKRQSDYSKEYDKLTSFKGWIYFPWLQYIQKYNYLFFNKTKKLSYNQKLFETNLHLIMRLKKYDFSLVKETYSYLESIKWINEVWYKNSLLLLRTYYKILLLSWGSDALESKRMYFDLISKAYSFWSQEKKLFYVLLLGASINKYDYENTDEFYKDILLFLQNYLGDFSDFSLENKWKNNSDKIFLDYFSFYIEKILVSNFQLWNSYLEDIIKILWKYVLLNKITYWTGDASRKKTWIYINLELLKNIQAYLRGIYFEMERGGGALLVMKKSDTGLYLKNSAELKKSVQAMKDFFIENQSLLDETISKDHILIDEYEALMDLYEEYFLALEDFDKYTLTYDEFKKQLNETQIYNSEKKDVLSEEAFISFMSQFSEVNISNMSLVIKDNTYYEAKDVFIWKNNFSFRLYPFTDYEISNIIINGEQKSFSYKLNIIKQERTDKNASSPDGVKKYDFNNFFVSTFFSPQEIKEKELFEKPVYVSTESRAIRVFKSSKLLWEKWEFKNVSPFLTIPYDTLFVQGTPWVYNVVLSWSSLNVDAKTFWTAENLVAQFFSYYKITEKDHYFYKIKLKIYKNEDINNFLLTWNFLNIIWNIDLPLFVEKMSFPLKDLKDIDFISELLKKNLWVETLDIKYYLSSTRTIIKFDFQGNITNIFLANWQVSAIMLGTKNILSQTVNVSELEKYLDILNK